MTIFKLMGKQTMLDDAAASAPRIDTYEMFTCLPNIGKHTVRGASGICNTWNTELGKKLFLLTCCCNALPFDSWHVSMVVIWVTWGFSRPHGTRMVYPQLRMMFSKPLKKQGKNTVFLQMYPNISSWFGIACQYCHVGHKQLTKWDAHPKEWKDGHGACVRLLKPAMNCAKVSLVQERSATWRFFTRFSKRKSSWKIHGWPWTHRESWTPRKIMKTGF